MLKRANVSSLEIPHDEVGLSLVQAYSDRMRV